MARVTAIIPAYNSEAYLAQAIDSALGQRGVDVEVIVIDDGSTDGTWGVIQRYGDAVLGLRMERVGPYRSRNHAARLASGDWLAFLDADDDWMPDKLVKQLERAGAETDLVYTDRVNFGESGRVSERQSDLGQLHEGDLFEPLLMGNFVTLSSVMIRKEAFERLGGFSEERFGVMDWEFWLRYAAEGGRARACSEPLTRYRWHAGAISNDHGPRCRDRLQVVQRALATPRGRALGKAAARRALANAWKTSAWFAAPSQPRQAIAWYLRAIRQWPWDPSAYKQIVKCCVGATT